MLGKKYYLVTIKFSEICIIWAPETFGKIGQRLRRNSPVTTPKIKGIIKIQICTLCKNGQVEDEEHFLLEYNVYKLPEHKFENFTEALEFFREENLSTLGKYLIEAFKAREKIKTV